MADVGGREAETEVLIRLIRYGLHALHDGDGDSHTLRATLANLDQLAVRSSGSAAQNQEDHGCPKCGKPSASPPAEGYCVDCATEGWEADAAAYHEPTEVIDSLRAELDQWKLEALEAEKWANEDFHRLYHDYDSLRDEVVGLEAEAERLRRELAVRDDSLANRRVAELSAEVYRLNVVARDARATADYFRAQNERLRRESELVRQHHGEAITEAERLRAALEAGECPHCTAMMPERGSCVLCGWPQGNEEKGI